MGPLEPNARVQMTSTDHASTTGPLPTGTVTFLFTDVVGSTSLWEVQREAMHISLARHDALLRGCIVDGGGYVVKTTGDGFHAVFADASDAIEAAIAGQKALHAEPWSKAATIRVRMALHTGTAELRDGDYYGSTVNRAARLAALGHGGQTLLSAVTLELCRDDARPGVTFRLLGEHRLKGLMRREAVYEVCHPDLPQAFPPLQTLLEPIDENTPSIAVLPFTDLSPEKNQEYFADGLAEELLNVLSKIHGVRVASRTSAFSFKGTKLDLPAVAKKLNVATILEGSVRMAGKRVRVGAHLIQTTTDSQLWSQSYDRELDDIFAVQDEIAQAVVAELRTRLLGETQDASATAQVRAEVQAAASGRGKDAVAYELYLQGRFHVDRFTPDDAAAGIEYYRRAIALDPEFALAWAWLARAYADQAAYAWAPAAEAFERAKDAAVESGPGRGTRSARSLPARKRQELARGGSFVSPGIGARAGKCPRTSPCRNNGCVSGPRRRVDRAVAPSRDTRSAERARAAPARPTVPVCGRARGRGNGAAKGFRAQSSRRLHTLLARDEPPPARAAS